MNDFTAGQFFLFCLFFCGMASNEATEPRKGYLFTAPKKLVVGKVARGCLSLYNLELPAHVLLELISPINMYDTEDSEKVLSRTSSVIDTKDAESCLELQVPYTKHTFAYLRLKITLEKNRNYTVDNREEVKIERDSLVTFVETDKPIYKPGQDVNIRILVLTNELKPWKEKVPKLWIESPSEVRVAQWSNLTLENGMAQLVFQLSPEPTLGTWKIKLQKTDQYPDLLHTSTFEVKEYVLPRFEVSVKGPKKVLASSGANITWDICAMYTYGQPVKGNLHVEVNPRTYYEASSVAIKRDIQVNSPDGCTKFTVSPKDFVESYAPIQISKIHLTANFTEAGTDVMETGKNEVEVVTRPFKLTFTSDTQESIKPGLLYRGQVRVMHFDDTPASGKDVEICMSGSRDGSRVESCRHFTTSSNGTIDFVIRVPNITDVSLRAHLNGLSLQDEMGLRTSDYKSMRLWYSKSKSYLQIEKRNQPIVCGEEYTFDVLYTMPANAVEDRDIVFQYVVNSLDGFSKTGQTKHRPTPNDRMNFDDIANLWTFEDDQGMSDDVHVYRFPLKIPIDFSLVPEAKLLIYYMHPTGEIVAASETIKIAPCFANKVKTSWNRESQTPGSEVSYNVDAASWSLCGISVVDKSTILLADSKKSLVDSKQVFDQLEKFRPENDNRWSPYSICSPRYYIPGPNMEDDFILRKRRTLIVPSHIPMYSGDYEFSKTAFEKSGTIVMTDLVLNPPECESPRPLYSGMFRAAYHRNAAPMSVVSSADNFVHEENGPIEYPTEMVQALSTTETTPLRSYFPETWLWELLPTGKDGKLTMERKLPHTITDWVANTICVSPTHGLGIAPAATIKAFQPFFLDYALPYSVKRGEVLHMKVSLFNYMQHSLPVQIKLEDAKGFDLSLTEPTASFCVDARSNIVHEYVLKPQTLGDVNITVSASIDSEFPQPCGPEYLVFTRDAIVKPILVQPEGFPVEETKSAFLCPKMSSNDTGISWRIDLPSDLIPGSERAFVTLVGDVLGPVFDNLDNLVQVPVGCGEQNMVLFVPNIQAIEYMDAARIENPVLRAKAIKNMERGYQRELTYRHADGSYSAFGSKDDMDEGSIWLTAFVVKSFAQARRLIHVDEKDLEFSANWLVKKQLDDGCFPMVGNVLHESMKGGISKDGSTAPLTAYILISLIESGIELPPNVIPNALSCLEKDVLKSNSSTYTLALYTYALTLLNYPNATDSMNLLLQRAKSEDHLLWWENAGEPLTEVSVEMTGYGLLSLVKLGGDENMSKALKVVRWMSKQRNSHGGFTSTQDTVVGLEAISKYAMAMNRNKTDLTVLVNADNLEEAHRINDDNRLLVIETRLPVLPTTVEIFADGEGCVMAQCTTRYNVANANDSKAFELTITTAPDKSYEGLPVQKITACARYTGPGEESNMALMEIGMISGYVPHRSSLVALTYDSSSRVKRFEEDHGVVTIYFDNLTHEQTCISFLVKRKDVVENTEPANVKLYDYYRQENTVSTNYNFAKEAESPAVIPH